jgi:hypothetical protein
MYSPFECPRFAGVLFDFLVLTPFPLCRGKVKPKLTMIGGAFRYYLLTESTTRLCSASIIRRANQPTIAPAVNQATKLNKFTLPPS